MISQPTLTILLGAQRFEPNVARVACDQGVTGRFAAITAGWREREGNDDELAAHFGAHGSSIVNLRLYQRCEDVFRRDPDLHAAHRERQRELMRRQDFYRIRLIHELKAARMIRARQASPAIRDEEERASARALTELDGWHVTRCQATRRAFQADWQPAQRPVVAEHRAQLLEILAGCQGVAIAGGHVATLLNRLDLFDLRDSLSALPVLAWSAGAMVACERIVLFHDSPPQGAGASQVLARGLNLAAGVVALPNPHVRLRLDDPTRVRVMAQRFAPAIPVGLPARAWVALRGQRRIGTEGALRLSADGTVTPLLAEEG